MHVVVCSLLILQLGCCTDEGLEAKTVDAEKDVTLLCNNVQLGFGFFFWMKIVPGKMPEIVGKRFGKSDEFNKIHHFTTKEEDGSFFLQISKAKPSDSAFYYCFSLKGSKITFLKAVLLEIKGPDSAFPAVVQSSVDPVSAGDVVALQCSVLSEFKNDACPEEQRVFYCTVAACGKVIFENGTELDVQVDGTHNSMSNNIFFFLFVGTSVLSLMMVVTFLILVVSKKSCDVCKVYLACKATSETVNDERQSQKINQNNVVYATTVFAKNKADKTRGRKGAKKEETVYSDVRVFEEN